MTITYNRILLITGMTVFLVFFSYPLGQIYVNASLESDSLSVEISFTMENTTILAGDEIVLHLNVLPFEYGHLEISCILPEGVMPVMEPGVIVRPYEEREHDIVGDPLADLSEQRYEIILWAGPVFGSENKGFIVRPTIPKTGSYEFAAIVKSLGQWGIKKEKLLIHVE
jgi:hypothetical protein